MQGAQRLLGAAARRGKAEVSPHVIGGSDGAGHQTRQRSRTTALHWEDHGQPHSTLQRHPSLLPLPTCRYRCFTQASCSAGLHGPANSRLCSQGAAVWRRVPGWAASRRGEACRRGAGHPRAQGAGLPAPLTCMHSAYPTAAALHPWAPAAGRLRPPTSLISLHAPTPRQLSHHLNHAACSAAALQSLPLLAPPGAPPLP